MSAPEGLTAEQWAAYLREALQGNVDAAAGNYAFDTSWYAEYGVYPPESPLYGTTPRSADPRRVAIQALIDQGATEGERAAARAAMERLDAVELEPDPRIVQDAQDEADFEDAYMHGAA